MSCKRFGVVAASVLGLLLSMGVVQAGAAGSTKVLKFHQAHMTQAAVGFNINANATPRSALST